MNEPEPIVGTVSQEQRIRPSPFPTPSSYCAGTPTLPALPLVPKPVMSKYGSLSKFAMGDMDGDGDLDVMMSMREYANLQELGYLGMHRNNGNGTFAPMQSWSFSAYYDDALALADMNNDGYLDVLQAGYHSPIVVMKNNGSGGIGATFQLPVFLAQGHKFVTTDLNNDGFKDVVLREYSGHNALHVALNNGGTAFGVYNKPTFPSFADFDLADLNGDGWGDLVLAVSASNVVQVRNGLGNATFGPPIDYPSVTGVASLGLRDLNGDGLIDLVASNGVTTEVRLKAGNGTFAAPVVYTGGSANIADLNGDGQLDLAGSTTLFNNGNGTFTSQMMAYLPHDGALFGDMNGDGLADIARMDGAEGVSLLLNGGNGVFARPFSQLNVNFARLQQVVSVDVTGDHLNDLVIVGSGNSTGIHVNLGNGNFAPPYAFPASNGASVIETADMNGDGYTDLVTANGSTVGVWLNDGIGTFASGFTYSVAPMPDVQIAVADLNGDGALDVARIASSGQAPNTSTLSVMLNQGSGTLGPSIDVGVGNAAPIDLFAADMNADGYIDLHVYGTQSIFQTFRNDGNGGFTNLNPNPLPGVVDFTSYMMPDVNGDDNLDTLSSGSNMSNNSWASLSINNGNGTYSTTWSTNWIDLQGRVVGAADIDRNGVKDIFVLRNNSTFVVYMNNGTTAGSRKNYLTSGNGLLVTDIDGDAFPELITTSGVLHKIACYP